MAGMKGITVNTAPEAEPHIYAEDDAAIYRQYWAVTACLQLDKPAKLLYLAIIK